MANEYLQRTPTSTGNRRVYTLAFWLKRTTYSTYQSIFSAANSNNVNETFLYFIDGVLRLFQSTGDGSGSAVWLVSTPQSIRDSSAMCHAVISVDTTQALSSDRVKIYINGVLSVISSATYPTINYLTNINTTELHKISGRPSGIQNFEGYLSDFFFIDGQALTPDVFGFYKQGKGYISVGSTQATDFRPGQWVPKTPRVIKTEINRRGGFGVNGFYLPMNDSNNFGADFHGDPNSIITLNEKLPQPRVGVATTASVGLGYTDALRADPYAANLVLALPFVSGGLSSGFGDYSHIIRGSGSAKVGVITAASNVSIANTSSYYGSAAYFDGLGDWINFGDNTDFEFGSGDFTIEFWRKRNSLSLTETYVAKYVTGPAATNSEFWFGTLNSGQESFYWYNGSTSYNIQTSNNIASIGQLDHLAAVRKGNVITLYLNGVAVGINTNVTYSLNTSSSPLYVGGVDRGTATGTFPFNGYLQDLRIYKGVAKYTGGFDVPRPYTPVGIATWRVVPDTTANNFATWNPISPASDTTFTNGNLTVAYGTNATRGVVTGTVGIAVTGAGKYYWENRVDASSTSPTNAMIGVWGMSTTTSAANYPGFTNTYGWSYYGDGSLYYATGTPFSFSSYGASYTTGDIISVTLDMTTSNGTLTFYKNGVSQGVATTGIGTFLTDGKIHAIMPALGDGSSAQTYTLSTNFGQNPTFSGNTTAGTFTDNNGKGLFKYQPPSGFLALCEDNLPTPAISDPGKYFKTVLYTGTGASRSIVGVGFTPDLVWTKSRTTVAAHWIVDSVRGSFRGLQSHTTDADTITTDDNLSFGADGFSLGASSNNYTNQSGTNYVAWCWRAGAGTTSTNTNGSITSVVSVNQDAGFSIVSYRSNGTSGATVGHSLARTPSFIIVKMRSSQAVGSADWAVYHKSLGATKNVWLNATNGANTSSAYWNNTEPTSSVFSLGNDLDTNHTNGYDYISYCWAEIEGFSKFGSYVGNGNADGPFVYCGFKPAWIMIKRTDAVANWEIRDSSRSSTNPTGYRLYPNLTSIEDTDTGIDFLSNGFKIRDIGSAFNASSGTYIFAAFAESPYAYSNSK